MHYFFARGGGVASDRSDVFYFNTFFYSQLEKGRNAKDSFSRVKNWSRNQDLFSKRLIIIPINMKCVISQFLILL